MRGEQLWWVDALTLGVVVGDEMSRWAFDRRRGQWMRNHGYKLWGWAYLGLHLHSRRVVTWHARVQWWFWGVPHGMTLLCRCHGCAGGWVQVYWYGRGWLLWTWTQYAWGSHGYG